MQNKKCNDSKSGVQHCSGVSALETEMLLLLQNDLPGNRDEINCALGEQRFSDAHELVHRLYGATCYCGVPELKQACKNLERELQQGTTPRRNIVDAFNAELDKLLV